MTPSQGIDIIIPVYNAFDDLVKCIDSIKAHTDLNVHRLVLINDASPDHRIAPYLDSLADSNILVFHNQDNLGFSGNINKGIAISNRDVLLLNSDTIVTRDWLNKILICSQSDETIGTVTPLSNNATLCSVPDFCQENQLPQEFSLEEYAALVESVSLKLYPSIPVANGFCMFIKRKLIDAIGLFDAETFGRGYGEENDFCYRAEQAGYRHVMCDDTYIYHTGTSSFIGLEKQKYISEHEKVLDARYPSQMQAVRMHCRDNPNWIISENIRMHESLRNGKKNILYLLQADFREDAHDNVGGTQLHVKDLCDGLKRQANIFIVAKNLNLLNLTIYINKKEYLFQFSICDSSEFQTFRNKEFAKLYGLILDFFQIDLIHIHHTLGLSLEMFYQAKERNIPLLATLHDYYHICPTIKLLNADGKFCMGIADDQMCRNCLKKRCSIYPGIDYIQIWRRENQKALSMADQIFVPSRAAKDIVISYYPVLAQKIQILEHGSAPLSSTTSPDAPSEKHPKTAFHVAFVGGISDAKGSYCASQLVKNSPKDIRWHLFGLYGHNDLSVVERSNFIKTGKYNREELPELIRKYQIDLICILPIWPETFCYTISEAALCGIPVIGTDIGALSHRIRDMKCGWLVPYEASYTQILELINRIKDKGTEYQEMKKNAEQLQMRTVSEMCQDYHRFYQNIFREISVPILDNADRHWVLDHFFVPNEQGYLKNNTISGKLKEAERQLWEISHSPTYRMVQMIGRMKIPFKKQLKGFVFRAYKRMN